MVGSLFAGVLACLLLTGCGGGSGAASSSEAPLNPFVGYWWGDDYGGLNIGPTGQGREQIDHRDKLVVWLRFRLVHTQGRPGKAVATIKLTVADVNKRAFVAATHRPPPHVGQLGELVLAEGVVTDKLTMTTFCRTDPDRRCKSSRFG